MFHNQIRCGIRDSRVLDPFAKYSLAARAESVLWLFGLFTHLAHFVGVKGLRGTGL